MSSGSGEITQLLLKWKDGDADAFGELMPLVYPHLRQVAAAYVRRERDQSNLQATLLVHELYLRLLSENRMALHDRQHFYTFAAKVMRLILIDHAREAHAEKRGGGIQHVPLSNDLPWVDVGSAEILQLNIALEELEKIDPYRVKLVELRYFLGCTSAETAALMERSKATVDRDLKFVRAWLFQRVSAKNVPALAAIEPAG